MDKIHNMFGLGMDRLASLTKPQPDSARGVDEHSPLSGQKEELRLSEL